MYSLIYRLPEMQYSPVEMAKRKIDNEALIAMVEARPHLWDRNHPDYKDRTKTVYGWEEICSALLDGCDDLTDPDKTLYQKEVIKRWNNMRDSFRKNLRVKLEESASGVWSSRARDYVYYKQLRFLEPILRPDIDRLRAVATGTEYLSEDSESSFYQAAPESSVAEATSMVTVVHDPLYDGDGRDESTVTRRKRVKVEDYRQIVNDSTETTPGRGQHAAFCDSFLPSIEDFNEDEFLDFQVGVLNLIRDIRKNRPSNSS